MWRTAIVRDRSCVFIGSSSLPLSLESQHAGPPLAQPEESERVLRGVLACRVACDSRGADEH
jgi:hypothetical protein